MQLHAIVLLTLQQATVLVLMTLKHACNTTQRSQTRVVLSLVLLSMGQSNPEPRLVNATLVELSSAVRLQGRTAYIAAGPGEVWRGPGVPQAH